jgi:hypothetical protein
MAFIFPFGIPARSTIGGDPLGPGKAAKNRAKEVDSGIGVSEAAKPPTSNVPILRQ